MSTQQNYEMRDIDSERNFEQERRISSINRRIQPYETRPFPTMTTVTSNNSQRLAQHMTIAGSFLDFALFVADVEHLKYLLDAGKENIRYYDLLIILIGASLFLQIIVVILMFIVGFRKNESTTIMHHQEIITEENENQGANIKKNNHKWNKIDDSNWVNKCIIILVTFIAIINVFATVFGDRSSADLIQKYRSDKIVVISTTSASTLGSRTRST